MDGKYLSIMHISVLVPLVLYSLSCYGGDQLCNDIAKDKKYPTKLDCKKDNILSTGETRENGKIVGEVIQLKDGTTIRKYNGTTFICKDGNCIPK